MQQCSRITPASTDITRKVSPQDEEHPSKEGNRDGKLEWSGSHGWGIPGPIRGGSGRDFEDELVNVEERERGGGGGEEGDTSRRWGTSYEVTCLVRLFC